MSTVRHPHIVQFLGVCFPPGSRLPALIMEKLFIDLHNLLENNPNIPLSMKQDILLDVAKGLTYLHTRSPAIIHRDLSARNVLLNSAMVAKRQEGEGRGRRRWLEEDVLCRGGWSRGVRGCGHQ